MHGTRDFENFNDSTPARDCFERGLDLDFESCASVRTSLPSLYIHALTFSCSAWEWYTQWANSASPQNQNSPFPSTTLPPLPLQMSPSPPMSMTSSESSPNSPVPPRSQSLYLSILQTLLESYKASRARGVSHFCPSAVPGMRTSSRSAHSRSAHSSAYIIITLRATRVSSRWI